MTDEEDRKLIEEISKRLNSETDIFIATKNEYLVTTLDACLNYTVPIRKDIMRFLT